MIDVGFFLILSLKFFIIYKTHFYKTLGRLMKNRQIFLFKYIYCDLKSLAITQVTIL